MTFALACASVSTATWIGVGACAAMVVSESRGTRARLAVPKRFVGLEVRTVEMQLAREVP